MIRISKRVPVRGTGLAMVGVLLLTATHPVFAQDTDESDHLDNLRECRAIADPTSRLACYDQAVGQVIAKTDAGELRVVDEEEIRETRRGLFGFSLPKLGIFGGDGEEDEADEILQSEITAVRRVRDEWHLTIAEGSVWRVSNAPTRFKARVGEAVEFEKAAMGSYWVRVGGRLGVKGRRVE